ncbi:MAG: aspartate carbamoyltransferase regulatory subunit [Desulfurococcales archaeon]|nr:aspartate carbamoyltransferase regulatory subunit [Desulfurococcales archaeon]MEB3789539.1 aspartate carbamoyltransferase regulatory subunit [Desulfurococcales archaeon]
MVEKHLLVSRIEKGTVIDHIPAGRALAVLKLLGITGREGYRVALVMNVESGRLGKKDIVKIEGVYVDEEHAKKIALVAPEATLNRIENYVVVSKKKLEPPEELEGTLTCTNPTCITRKPREPVTPRFYRVRGKKLRYQCIYCSTIISEEEIVRQLAGEHV